MTGYRATARIGRVTPRVLLGTAGDPGGADSVLGEADRLAFEDDASVVDDDAFADQLEAIGERWNQLTFYLFDPQSWR